MEKAAARVEMAEVVYQRGEAAFAKGKYQETIEALTNCLSMEKSEECQYLETEALECCFSLQDMRQLHWIIICLR